MATWEELERACRILAPLLEGRVVRGVGLLAGSLDLCFFFSDPPHPQLRSLRLAVGGPRRARLLLEAARFSKSGWLEGETPRRVRGLLEGARLLSLGRVPGERRVELCFEGSEGQGYRIVGECFGSRGNWFLLDAGGRILAQARRAGGGRSGLGPGAPYRPPGGGPTQGGEGVELPPDPETWLRERAAWFEALDRQQAFEALHRELHRGLGREARKVRARLEGLRKRQASEARAEELKREGELLLAHEDPRLRGLQEVRVPDWYDRGRPRILALDPALSLLENARRRFDRARKLREGAPHTRARIGEAEVRSRALEALGERLASLEGSADLEALRDLASEIPAGAGRRKPGRPGRRTGTRKPYRTFLSHDRLPILVGKKNEDNDRLSLSIAKGNDVWLHVGSGHAGSHVVIRLPRGKNAPLESLLDAGQLALHFSKARGRGEVEVLYTQAKHLRKRKGAKPGAVDVLRFKTLRIRPEKGRLDRLLATREPGD